MTEHTTQHNTDCDSPLHKKHLCYIVSQGFHLSDKEDYQCMVNQPRYKCTHCGRVANEPRNLCKPVKL